MNSIENRKFGKAEGLSYHKFYLEEKAKELRQAMILTGSSDVNRISPSVIVRNTKGNGV